MPIPHELAIMREAFYHVALPDRLITVDVLNCFSVQHKEPSVDPAFTGLGLLMKFSNLIPRKHNSAKAGWRTYRGHGSQFPVGMVEFQESFDIKISYSITIGKHKGLILTQPTSHTFETPTGLRI